MNKNEEATRVPSSAATTAFIPMKGPSKGFPRYSDYGHNQRQRRKRMRQVRR